MTSTIWTEAHYTRLMPLWRQWLTDTRMTDRQPLLDRWLKRNLSTRAGRSVGTRQPHRAEVRQPLDLSQHMALSSAMFTAMRFLQLAAALEQSYHQQSRIEDWHSWDLQWSPTDSYKIPSAALWYWVALRDSEDAAEPGALRDAAQRKEWFAQCRHAAGQDDSLPAFLIWHGLRPHWSTLLLERAHTSNWSSATLHRFVSRQNETPPLWLRPQGELTIAELSRELTQEGVKVVTDEQGVFARGGTGITETGVYQRGQVEIQDLASQIIATRVAAQPGDKVWDACAGAGGKSLAIAARMSNKGVILATDLHLYKLDELKRRAKRAGFFNIRTFEWQGRDSLRLPVEAARQQGFDWVLIDAPCTSSGTWRRNPDARWRFTDADTDELVRLQQEILTHACAAVRIQGRLVYATCSWQVSENEQQIEAFLQQHPNFSLVSQDIVGAPHIDADTMFVAVMARTH